MVLCILLGQLSHALRFYIKDRERLCFYLSARRFERLQGEAILENGKGNAKLSVEIASEDGHVLFERHDAKIGVFTVTIPPPTARGGHYDRAQDVETYDIDAYHYSEHAEPKYKACLLLTVDPDPHRQSRVQRAVSFRLRPADRADEDGASGGRRADRQKVDSIASSLEVMLSQLNGMAQDLVQLQSREHVLVAHNQSTGQRLAQFTIVSLVVLVATALFQYSHYKSFFTSKKLC